MDKEIIKKHIEKKEAEKAEILAAIRVIEREVEGFNSDIAFSCCAVLNSKFAQCDISIRDHKRLL